MSFRLFALMLCAALQFFAASPALSAETRARGDPLALAYNVKPWTGDLDGMIQRRQVRVLVPYNKALYFLDKGGTQRGIIADMMTAFENDLNAQLKNKNIRVYVVFLPTSRERLIPDLLAGKGDIAAANLTITDERKKLVDFSTPLATGVREIIVASPGAPELKSLDDLAGQELFINPASSYYASVKNLNADLQARGLKPAIIRDAPGIFETDDILEMASADLIKYTVADRYLAVFWKQIFPQIRVYENLEVDAGNDIAFAFRKDSPKLAATLNPFIVKNRIGTSSGNQQLTKYLKSVKWVKSATDPDEIDKFHRLADFFRKYGDQYNIDWLLMMAQGYQESRLDQNAKSSVGAVGVMQIMPATGKDLKVGDIRREEYNIHGGVKYIRFMIDQYYAKEPMTDLNKGLFAFAAYNAGPGRINQLRKEAAAKGLDPNVWFDNVERVAAERIGRETVQYVSNIYKYYIAYSLVRAQGAAAAN
ncbi:transglycosylase SLT domain-containing protein [Achromobacter deleyi]|uniref:transglycosylase SLT domain-containing protein n=1 Tax=Achromobacter deleyi TaxID=1353891 RepID=UPI001490D293|nr:transporter substrate-binding domain-containing protein [Achromobacter deleyi]QVQ28208.1 transporter substrate-binding domain-containing protein [Achromobacter deleyi]UIP18400.1 transporter substrate-binding domain-containing protein [Achromobacter deleyi]